MQTSAGGAGVGVAPQRDVAGVGRRLELPRIVLGALSHLLLLRCAGSSAPSTASQPPMKIATRLGQSSIVSARERAVDDGDAGAAVRRRRRRSRRGWGRSAAPGNQSSSRRCGGSKARTRRHRPFAAVGAVWISASRREPHRVRRALLRWPRGHQRSTCSVKARKARSGEQARTISRRRIVSHRGPSRFSATSLQARFGLVPEGVERGARRLEAARVEGVDVARALGAMRRRGRRPSAPRDAGRSPGG